jgi:hypothetical protein
LAQSNVNSFEEQAMEPIYFVMAILGCGDDGAQCQQARLEPAHYQSAAACQAAAQTALQNNADLDFPVIAASCQRGNASTAQNDQPRRGS